MAATKTDEIHRLSFSHSSKHGESIETESNSGHSCKVSPDAAGIDFDHINKSLDHVNNFLKLRVDEKLPLVLMYEITSSGESKHIIMTLRELLQYLDFVNDDSNEISKDTYDVIGALRLRDLRRLDFQFNPNEERSILIRKHVVLFAMASS